MRDTWKLLARLRRLLGLGHDGETLTGTPRPPHADDPPPGCQDVADISCQEAVRRVYQYLDGELDGDDAEVIRCHVQQCRRCYPMYNWERMFLDVVRERGDRPEAGEALRRRVVDLLDRRAS